MILKSAHKDTQNPAGQIVNPVKQGRPLLEEIEAYTTHKAYQEGYDAGYRQGYADRINEKFREPNSEESR